MAAKGAGLVDLAGIAGHEQHADMTIRRLERCDQFWTGRARHDDIGQDQPDVGIAFQAFCEKLVFGLFAAVVDVVFGDPVFVVHQVHQKGAAPFPARRQRPDLFHAQHVAEE